MRQIKLSKFRAACMERFPGGLLEVEFVCPSCKTVQTGNDLIKAGAGKDYDEVSGYFGFSCVGRFNKKAKGCDWTLGGFFQIHTFEIVCDETGSVRPCFELNPPLENGVFVVGEGSNV